MYVYAPIFCFTLLLFSMDWSQMEAYDLEYNSSNNGRVSPCNYIHFHVHSQKERKVIMIFLCVTSCYKS